MQRRTARRAPFLLCAVLLGCSQVLDFDRSKIEARSELDGGVDPFHGGTLADGARPDGNAGQNDASVGDAAPGCTQHRECGAQQLCCGGKCVATSVTEGCESCGEQCTLAANSCTARVCTCGDSPACSGATRFCGVPAPGASPRCLECRGDADCADRSDGKKQCVTGSCAACDVADGNSGCTNPKPLCDSNVCVPCDASLPCAGAMTCVEGSCFGCDASDNSGCDPGGTTPVCQAAPAPQTGLYQCVGCSGDAQCAGNLNGDQCVAGACEACDPTSGQNNAGCDASSGKPICDVTTRTCRACQNGDCSGSTCSTGGPTAGRCVACTNSAAQCTTAAQPLCDPSDGTCKPCGSVSGGDAACAASGKNNTCDETSGSCVQCTADAQCAGATPHCDTAHFVCVGCRNANDCGGSTPFCDGTTHACRGCSTASAAIEAADCPTAANPACGSGGRCAPCRVSGPSACKGSNAQCSNNACVECLSPADCKGGDPCTSKTCNGNVCSYPTLPVDDGVACTVDSCSGGRVTHMPDNTRCPETDMLSCTIPTCSATTGCSEVPNHARCTDARDCFLDMCTGSGGQPVTGCSSAPLCDGGICALGVCTP